MPSPSSDVRPYAHSDIAPLLQSTSRSSVRSASPSSSFLSDDSFTSGRQRRRDDTASLRRVVSFACAMLSALCAGSVAVFSLYGHIFQERLRYDQFRVNGLASAASVALYLPVLPLGYVCDRVGPAPLSALSAVTFGLGYALAAVLYRQATSSAAAPGDAGHMAGGDGQDETRRSEYVAMLVAFVFIGVGTCAMYLSAVTTCAKNFGRGKHRGLALAVPIAAFGLSGMWESQVASRLLYERLSDGSKGDVDVFKFFVFLAILLPVIGVIGTFGLRIVDEKELIDDAVDELERSGILESSGILPRPHMEYGTVDRRDPFTAGDHVYANRETEEREEARMKKQWLLNAETSRFLRDSTMWLLASGFLLMVGPGEAFINNLGTIIKTLYPPDDQVVGPPTSAATHVSIVGLTSTILRLLTGSLTDLLAPSPHAQHVQITPSSPVLLRQRFSVSRVSFLLLAGAALSAGLVVLASGVVQGHGERFWIVSGLVGAGYGAVFSVTPIIITVIWGVENFGTNWGIVAMLPAAGSTCWGLVYSAVYNAGVRGPDGGDGDVFCYGVQCYAATFWTMTVTVWIACGLIFWAWRGKNGWVARGILI